MESNKTGRRKKVLLIVSGVLLVIALGLLLFCILFTIRGGKASEAALSKLLSGGKIHSLINSDLSERVLPEDNFPEKKEEYKDYELNPYIPMPVEEIDGHRYIGVISIPDINLELPIIENWNYDELTIAPCRYTGSVYQDNMIICGHNHSKHFLNIKTLHPGAKIYFTDTDGNVFSYELTGKEKIMHDDIEGMLAGDWDMTLFTCSPLRIDRVALRCKRIR